MTPLAVAIQMAGAYLQPLQSHLVGMLNLLRPSGGGLRIELCLGGTIVGVQDQVGHTLQEALLGFGKLGHTAGRGGERLHLRHRADVFLPLKHQSDD